MFLSHTRDQKNFQVTKWCSGTDLHEYFGTDPAVSKYVYVKEAY